jgi:hypothetical protein
MAMARAHLQSHEKFHTGGPHSVHSTAPARISSGAALATTSWLIVMFGDTGSVDTQAPRLQRDACLSFRLRFASVMRILQCCLILLLIPSFEI